MKFPFFKQLDSMDCGPSCLRMVAKFYGKTYSLQALRSKAFLTKSGVSMLGISDAAESIGFRTRGYRLTWEQLRDEVPLPCIVHWNQRHFVVVYNIGKRRRLFGRSSEHRAQSPVQTSPNHRALSPEQRDVQDSKYIVHVADPAAGLLKYAEAEFLKCWYSTKSEGLQEGTALLLEPTPDFYRQEGEQKGKLKFMYLLGYIRPYSKYILQLMLGMLTASNRSACAKKFHTIMNIIDKNNPIKVQLILSPAKDEISVQFMKSIFRLMRADQNRRVLEELKLWYKTDRTERSKLLQINSNVEISDGFEEMIKYNSLLFSSGKVTAVPSVYVNGYPLPGTYSMDDIRYHISELEKMQPILIKIEV